MEFSSIARIEKAGKRGRSDSFRLGVGLTFVVLIMLYAGLATGANAQYGVMVVAAAMIGGYMAMNIGANDVANNVGHHRSGGHRGPAALRLADERRRCWPARSGSTSPPPWVVSAAQRMVPTLVGLMVAAFSTYLILEGLSRVWKRTWSSAPSC